MKGKDYASSSRAPRGSGSRSLHRQTKSVATDDISRGTATVVRAGTAQVGGRSDRFTDPTSLIYRLLL